MALHKSMTLLALHKEGSKFARFTKTDDGGEHVGVVQDLYMANDYFKEFGKPKEITVVIEPGDKLNESPAPAKKGKGKA